MRLLTAIVVFSLTLPVRGEMKSINPAVKQIVDSVSEEHIAATLKKLESFETRNLFSEDDNPTRGIGAARRWIYDQFKSYSSRLQVRYDSYRVKQAGRIFRDVELHNVVAVLPGTLHPERHILLSAHYDSLALKKGPETLAAGEDLQFNADNMEDKAPGVTDDGSGTAAVLELARIMSQCEFEKTIVFVAFAGEEERLIGSALYAEKAKAAGEIIDAVLNNDIIGSDVSGNGRINNGAVSVFSEEPNDSLSRQVARYIKDIGERYMPSMRVDLIFRHDRFGRGGDHTPFNQEGYAAVRVTTPNENFANQHTTTDTFANTSVSYTTRVARINAAALASLALAPNAPVVVEEITKGERKGQFTPMIARGKSRYAARLRWKNEKPEPDLGGYAVVMRATTSPYWEREIFVGNVTEFELPDVSIDTSVFGVKAVDRDGNESLVSAYVNAPLRKIKIDTY